MKVEDLIKKIELRPGMYVGTQSLEAIVHFVNGYLYNNIEANRADDVDMAFKNCFHEWVKVHLEKDYFIKLEEQRNYIFYISQIFQGTEHCNQRRMALNTAEIACQNHPSQCVQ